MKRRNLYSLAFVAALVLAACDSSAPPAGDTATVHTGQGTVNSIHAAAGTVNISHSAVASADWPAMTMSFKLADPSAASTVKAGDRVEFQFTIEGGMAATVTKLEAE